MTKWEYLCIYVKYDGNKDKIVCFVNDRELRNWKHGDDLYEYVTQLGDQGWESVAISGKYWFKRPKP